MNASSFTQAMAAIALTATLVGCATTGNARSYPQERDVVVVDHRPPRFPLIIVRTPTIVINRYHDGRYYYRNPQGCYYWQGYDGRFYLEDRYVSRSRYDDRSYRDWQHKGKKRGHYHNKHRH